MSNVPGWRRRGGAVALVTSVTLALAGCGGDGSGSVEAGGDTGELTFWVLEGASPEADALKDLASQFEQQNPGVKVTIVGQPPADFNQTVLTSPIDELPDLMVVDGPLVASYAYNGKLAPVQDWVSEETLSNQTAAVQDQNTWNDETYAVSLINSGMGLWGNKSLLDAAGVSLPETAQDAWTAEEFNDALEKLAAQDEDGKPLTIAENNGLTLEYGIYGFAPVLWSAGQPIFTDGKAEGSLDSDAAVEAFTAFQDLRQYTDPDTDGQALQSGRVALAWMGHWMYGSYQETLGDDLVVGPLPDFGQGSKAGSGSIAYGISAGSKHAALAGKFLDFLASDDGVAAYATAAGAPPATTTGLEASETYGPGGALELLGNQLTDACPTEADLSPDCVSVVRPVTPGYPIVTTEVSKAVAAIWSGDDPQKALSGAARAIDRDFSDNDGYTD